MMHTDTRGRSPLHCSAHSNLIVEVYYCTENLIFTDVAHVELHEQIHTKLMDCCSGKTLYQ